MFLHSDPIPCQVTKLVGRVEEFLDGWTTAGAPDYQADPDHRTNFSTSLRQHLVCAALSRAGSLPK
jgi:hypothetical protein